MSADKNMALAVQAEVDSKKQLATTVRKIPDSVEYRHSREEQAFPSYEEPAGFKSSRCRIGNRTDC